jgi:hypothetical protein
MVDALEIEGCVVAPGEKKRSQLAQIELDRALRMIKLGHPVDKGEQMVSVHVEGAGVKIPISIDRHRDLLVSNKERR